MPCISWYPHRQVIAVRDGKLFLRGQPKVPTWTRLNATAAQGDTQVLVQGAVNWEIGAWALDLHLHTVNQPLCSGQSNDAACDLPFGILCLPQATAS